MGFTKTKWLTFAAMLFMFLYINQLLFLQITTTDSWLKIATAERRSSEDVIEYVKDDTEELSSFNKGIEFDSNNVFYKQTNAEPNNTVQNSKELPPRNFETLNLTAMLLNKNLRYTTCDILKTDAINNVNYYKYVFQHFNLSINNHEKPHKAYLLNFYFDDRFPFQKVGYNREHDQLVMERKEGFEYYVRTVVSVNAETTIPPGKNTFFNFNLQQSVAYGYFWYEQYINPIVMPCGFQNSANIIRAINGTTYYQYVLNCPVPEIEELLPVAISVSSSTCSLPKTYHDITYPELPTPKEANIFENSNTSDDLNSVEIRKEIGLCLQPMYGSQDDSDVTFLVSWMELLKILGVSEVLVTNVSQILKGDKIKRAYDYYKDSGFLKMSHIPIIHPHYRAEEEQAGICSIKQMALTDCFMRKIKRYWYVLIHDNDEIIIPRTHNTYQEFLSEYFRKNTSASGDDCLSVRSAYFYRNIEQLRNNSYPDYIPPLKVLSRFEPEPLGIPYQGGVGMSKSFSKMSTLVASGSHMCRETHDRTKGTKKSYLPYTDILFHHYRKHCKSLKGLDGRCEGSSDKYHPNTTLIYDDVITRFASTLIPAVEAVLTAINYFS